MTRTGPSIPTRIAAGLLATIILASGCASRAFVFLEQDQSPAQLAKDQAECTAEAQKNADATRAVGKGLRTTFIGSLAGAILGAGLGALLGVWIAANASPSNPTDAGLIIGGGAGVGAVNRVVRRDRLWSDGDRAAVARPRRRRVSAVHEGAATR